MKFEETFLEHTDQQKFNLFRVLKTMDDETMSIHEISHRLNLSYQQTYGTFQLLVKDMGLINHRTYDRTVAVLNASSFDVSLDRYRNYLITHSIAFSFFDYVIQDEHASMTDFCEAHDISRSTLSRKVVALRNLLLDYQLDLSVTKAALLGDEKRLREFVVCIYYIAFRLIDWPLVSVSYDEALRVYEKAQDCKMAPAPSENDSFLDVLRVGVSILRINQRHLLNDSKRLAVITENNEDFNGHIFEDYHGQGVTSEYLAEEAAYYYFQEVHSFHFSAPLTQFETRFYDYITAQKSIVYHLVYLCTVEIAVRFSSEIQTAIIKDKSLMLNFWRLVLSFYILDGNYPRVTDFYEQLPYRRQKGDIFDFLKSFFKSINSDSELKIFQKYQDTMTPLVYYLLLPKLKETEATHMVNVQLLMENESVARRDLHLFLQDLRFVNLIDTDEGDAVDLIVTTTPTIAMSSSRAIEQHIPIFAVSGLNYEKEYYGLYQRLFELYER